MNFSKYLIVFVLLAGTKVSSAQSRDTIDLLHNPMWPEFELGWTGEAWCDSAKRWWGDTLYKDKTIDTVVKHDTQTYTGVKQIFDTLYKGTDTQKVVIKDTTVTETVITNDTTFVDSSQYLTPPKPMTMFNCDTGGLEPGVKYMNYYYKWRDYWAQCPIIWNNWQGTDASGFKKLLVAYKGPLPTHKIKLDFFYACWGGLVDTTKNVLKKGDGAGELPPSTTQWTIATFTIPDSVDMVGVTGLVFNIVNSTGSSGTSDVGNLKIGKLALIGTPSGINHATSGNAGRIDKLHFIPKTAGKVAITLYSLNGEVLSTRSLDVEANKAYSIRQVAKRSGVASPQVRLIKIKGAGVDAVRQIW